MKLSLTATLLSLAAVDAKVASLTTDNVAELTAGKTVFLKFFAPCKSHFGGSFFRVLVWTFWIFIDRFL